MTCPSSNFNKQMFYISDANLFSVMMKMMSNFSFFAFYIICVIFIWFLNAWLSPVSLSISFYLCLCSPPNCLGNMMPTCPGVSSHCVVQHHVPAPCLKRQQLLSNWILFEHQEPSGQKCREKHTFFPLLAFCSTFCVVYFVLHL